MKIYCGFGFNVDFQVVSYSLFLTKRTMINMIPWPLTQKKIMILINTDNFFFLNEKLASTSTYTFTLLTLLS